MKLLQTIALATSLLAESGALAAQGATDSIDTSRAARATLEALVRKLEVDSARGPSGAARRNPQLAALRARLTDGDFRRGDRVALRVASAGDQPPTTGDDVMLERQLSDTFTVTGDLALPLPILGAVSLRGVLRSELDAHLTREVSRYIRFPAVHARVLVRVAVHGGVVRPGYYSLPAATELAAALAAAGGPARGARLTKLSIRRDGKALYNGKTLQQAIADGRSLEELGVRPGDEVIVPERRSAAEIIRTTGVLLSIPLTVVTLLTLL